MFCPECGNRAEDGDVFCAFCGTKFFDSAINTNDFRDSQILNLMTDNAAGAADKPKSNIGFTVVAVLSAMISLIMLIALVFIPIRTNKTVKDILEDYQRKRDFSCIKVEYDMS